VEKKKIQIGVLEGHVTTSPAASLNPKLVTIGALKKVELEKAKNIQEPVPVTEEEWSQLREAYELVDRGAAFEARQMDLSKEAGGFFQSVFDHGTFYSPRIGFSEREFIKEKDGKVYFQAGYDVFPRAAVVGVYFKIRNLDLSKFDALEFEARRSPDEHFPDSFRIELKSKTATVRGYAQRNFEPDWKTVRLPFQAGKSLPISEMVFVFTNETAGVDKKGALQFRNFTLIPLSKSAQSKPVFQVSKT